jgi:sugar lactone lactonase YvrE
VLATEAEGLRLGFTDDVAVDASGKHAYFSDASSKWDWAHYMDDIVEHGGHGRLLRYDFDTGQTSVLVRGMQFANGLTLGPDEAYVLVNETGSYRVRRYWLKGEKAGTEDVFLDNLPGFPDNITFNGRDRFWVAIFGPRDPLLDANAGHVFVRKVVSRVLPVLPPLTHRVMALAFDPQGKLVASLQDDGREAYSPLTCVREAGPWLYFGSLKQDSFGRMPLEAALAHP